MKFFAVAVVLCLVVATQALTDEQKEQIKTVQKKCIEGTGVDVELVKKARAGTFEANNDKLNNYLFCFLKSMGGINDAGEFQADIIKTRFGPLVGDDNITKILAECLVKGSTPQESAFKYAECSYKYKGDYPSK